MQRIPLSCVLAISLPKATSSGDTSPQSHLQTRETSLHHSRNGSIPPSPLKELPYHLSALAGTSAPGKVKKNLFLGVGRPRAGSTVPPSSLCCLRRPCSPGSLGVG